MIDILITLLVMLILFAVVAYILNTYVLLDPPLRQLIMLILGVIFVIWVLLALAGYAPVWHGRALR